jgi:hypothetical protein
MSKKTPYRLPPQDLDRMFVVIHETFKKINDDLVARLEKPVKVANVLGIDFYGAYGKPSDAVSASDKANRSECLKFVNKHMTPVHSLFAASAETITSPEDYKVRFAFIDAADKALRRLFGTTAPECLKLVRLLNFFKDNRTGVDKLKIAEFRELMDYYAKNEYRHKEAPPSQKPGTGGDEGGMGAPTITYDPVTGAANPPTDKPWTGKTGLPDVPQSTSNAVNNRVAIPMAGQGGGRRRKVGTTVRTVRATRRPHRRARKTARRR